MYLLFPNNWFGKIDVMKAFFPSFWNSSEVYMQDLESGLSFMLNVEVATKPIIQGDEYLALRNFIGMLAKVT